MDAMTQQLRERLIRSNGRFISVRFVKRNGEIRYLHGQVRRQDLHRATDTTVPVFDMSIGEVRNVSVDKVLEMKDGGETIKPELL